MKILVDEMPMWSRECCFSIEEEDWDKCDRCSFTGEECTLPDGYCKFLIEGKNILKED